MASTVNEQDLNDLLNEVRKRTRVKTAKQKEREHLTRNIRSRETARQKTQQSKAATYSARARASRAPHLARAAASERTAAARAKVNEERSQQRISEIVTRHQERQEDRQEQLEFAQALGQERATNAILREYGTTQARLQARTDYNRQPDVIAGKIGGAVGSSVMRSGPSQAVFGTLGSIIAAIAIAIILYIVLNNASGVSGTTNSILSFVTALTSTDPLFTSSQSSGSTSSTSSSTSSSNTGGGGSKAQ